MSDDRIDIAPLPLPVDPPPAAKPRRKRTTPKRRELSRRMAQSALSNGTVIVAGLDHRGRTMRRLKSLISANSADMGLAPGLASEAQVALARRISFVQVVCEKFEARFATEGDAAAVSGDVELYLRAVTVWRRLVECVGLHTGRRARDVSLDLSAMARAARRAHPTGRNDHDLDPG